MKLRTAVRVCAILGVASLLMTGLSLLALQDIWHGREPDLALEWQMVRVGYGCLALFYAAAFYMIRRVLRSL